MATTNTIPKSPAWELLPAELWAETFSLLTQKDHFALSHVSRRLHVVVEPHLYSSFTWIPDITSYMPPISKMAGFPIKHYTKSRRKKRNWTPGRYGPPPYLLLRTLLHHPKFASYFRNVKVLAVLPSVGLFHDRHEAREGGLSDLEFETCVRDICLMKGKISWMNWLQGLIHGTADVAVALLLHR